MEQFLLNTKTAIVTGASRGIGFAITKALLNLGVTVAGWSRTKPEDFSHPKYFHFETDIADQESVDNSFKQTIDKLNHQVDYLINNAGIGHNALIEETEPEVWRKLFDVNVHGLFYASRLAIPVMKSQESGHIVNISSGAGTNGIAGMSAYCGTKYAVNGISDSMHKELRGFGIKVTCLSPGSVDTGFSSSNKNKILPDELAQSVIHILRSPENFHYTDVQVRPLRPNL
ncbi:MAG: SDR family NAD(P)-dependent oxidoreductase [Balneolaceae bacterium]|nr:SDR family NAD(P)-dependent oxidoreductase [Balneolaceae bacterium]